MGTAIIPAKFTLQDGTCIRLEQVTTASHIVDPSDPEAWFWSEQWQAGEREADADIASGNGTHHASGEDFLASL